MKYTMLGRGFLANAIRSKIEMREVELCDHPDYLFDFRYPSSQRLFDGDYHCISETIEGFIKTCEYAKRHGCKLIFPSSSTVYDNNDSYSLTKSALEDIVRAFGVDYVAFRIFAGYGPGEGHKRHYASPIYQFAKDMVNGKSAVIYGDGSQKRDFVFIDDIVKTVINNVDKMGIIDVGTGVSVDFNTVVLMINSLLLRRVDPVYVPKPTRYIQETKCKNPINNYTPVYRGIEQVVRSLYAN